MLEYQDKHAVAGDNTLHVFAAAAVMRPAGNVSVMLVLAAIAVDVVNVTVAEAVPAATAVVMLSAVAAAETQPTHGVFARAEIVSLVVLISTPPLADAKEAASGAVVRPLHVTVTAPAETYALPARLIVIAFAENDDDQVPPINGESIRHALAEAAVIRPAGNVSVIASALIPKRSEEVKKVIDA